MLAVKSSLFSDQSPAWETGIDSKNPNPQNCIWSESRSRSLVPRKLNELIKDLKKSGFCEIAGGKGSHRKFTHEKYPGAVTLSGKSGSDAKHYQEKQVKEAIKTVEKGDSEGD